MTPGSPLAALAPLIMQRIAASQGGGPGGPGGGLPGGPPSGPGGPGGPGTGPGGSPADAAASASYGRELSSARQADPAALVKAITDVKSKVSDLMTQTLMSTPGVGRALSKTIQGLDAAIKEATQAAVTLQTASPIQASAAQGAPGM